LLVRGEEKEQNTKKEAEIGDMTEKSPDSSIYRCFSAARLPNKAQQQSKNLSVGQRQPSLCCQQARAALQPRASKMPCFALHLNRGYGCGPREQCQGTFQCVPEWKLPNKAHLQSKKEWKQAE